MKYRIEISSVAESEADQAALRISQFTSPAYSRQWYLGLLQAIKSLSQMPNRCALARENEKFSLEIRQLLYGKGRNLYRVLFTILDSDIGSTVRILHIRHGLQKTIGEEDDETTST